MAVNYCEACKAYEIQQSLRRIAKTILKPTLEPTLSLIDLFWLMYLVDESNHQEVFECIVIVDYRVSLFRLEILLVFSQIISKS